MGLRPGRLIWVWTAAGDDAAIHQAMAASRISVVVLVTDPGEPGQYQMARGGVRPAS